MNKISKLLSRLTSKVIASTPISMKASLQLEYSLACLAPLPTTREQMKTIFISLKLKNLSQKQPKPISSSFLIRITFSKKPELKRTFW